MKKLLIIFSSIVLLAGCKKYLDVNKNIDAPATVDGYLYLAGIQQAYEGVYWDLRATAPLTQMMGTSGTYSTFAIHDYIGGSDAAGEAWRMAYWMQGMNLENLIKQSEAAEDWTLAGIGYAIKAFSWDLMTKINGDLILKDAFVPGLLSHRYDYQKDVYTQIREWAYKAIELLEKTDSHEYGTKISANDYMYGGERSKWIKFAYAVIVRNLSSLSNKSNFVSEYGPELVDAAAKSFQSTADDAVVNIAGGSQSSPFASYNNFWGTARANLSRTFFQHEYAVQVFTGTVPKYDELTGDKTPVAGSNFSPYELAPNQIVTDTLVNVAGHWDPRVAVKLGTASDPNYSYIDNADTIKTYKYYGGTFTGTSGPIGNAASYYGRNVVSAFTGTTHDGIGKWIYRDNAPYILTTCAEIKFCLAEALWKMNRKSEAFDAFKAGVQADMAFTVKHLYPGAKGKAEGGDKITQAVFNAYSQQYIAGPFVNGLSMSDFSLSHIMMQKFVALYPWGAHEAWVDQRKYHYDIAYTGQYPSLNNGWSVTTLNQKWDSNPGKVFKGLYLQPALVQGRKGKYDIENEGAPTYRIRPRYNSEYMWNRKSLDSLKPISGMAANYHTSIPWFAYPGELPN